MNEFRTVCGLYFVTAGTCGPNCTVTLDLENALINISRDKLRINVSVSFLRCTINNHHLTIAHVKSTKSEV